VPTDWYLPPSAVRKLVVLLYLAAGLACAAFSFVLPPAVPGTREGEISLLTTRDVVNGVINVKLFTEEKPSPLILEAACDHNGVCGFSLRNVTDEAQSARDFYLSDKLDKPKKWSMTGINFSPGEVVNFVGKNYRHADTQLKLKVNFNIKRGKIVYLRDKSGVILSSIVVR
jgi:hypothetical protein